MTYPLKKEFVPCPICMKVSYKYKIKLKKHLIIKLLTNIRYEFKIKKKIIIYFNEYL